MKADVLARLLFRLPVTRCYPPIMLPRDHQIHGSRAALVAEHLAAAARAAGDEVAKRVVVLLTEGNESAGPEYAEEKSASTEAIEKARVAVATLKASPEQRAVLKGKRGDARAKMLEDWGLYQPRGCSGLEEE